ncbi:MAG: toll/interleukin-1 receptor domain-containing protein [Cyanobacteria bacterium P01_A01_bin.116]
MRSNHEIFISYAHTDRAFAQALTQVLESTGNHVCVWKDTKIEAGSDWEQEIQRALNKASVVVLITSKDALASQYVNYEIGSAIAAEAQVIPVLIDDVESLPTYLGHIHPVDARGRDEASVGVELAAAIKEIQTASAPA